MDIFNKVDKESTIVIATGNYFTKKGEGVNCSTD